MLTRRKFLIGAATVVAAATGCSSAMPRPEEIAPEQGASQPGVPGQSAPLRVALLSDPHVQSAASPSALTINTKLVKAIADMKAFKPDYWAVNGDVTDNGYPGQYAAFKEIIAKAARPDQVLLGTGNHEFYDKEATDEQALARFREAFGQEQPYSSRIIGDIHMVMLGTEQWKTAPRNPDWAWLSPAQLRWFEQVLTEHRERFTVVCLHQPLRSSGQASELQGVLAENPQIRLWFSGHTHQPVNGPGQVSTQQGTTFLGLGSTCYQFVPAQGQESQAGQSGRAGYTKDFKSSHGRFLEVWPDRVLVRARDHVRQVWLDGQDLTIQRS